ncbi:MAG: hypothetical protein KAR42_15555 [candidate division Zixibacteria bacterium]|nr:hypothetical protein [candidate division Zixibacteria bacterium]
MIDSEKQEFLQAMRSTGDLYGKEIPNERVAIYWEALKYRELADVKAAINRHIQDPNRGRFFPLPADVAAQLPKAGDAWLTGDEAWALCPKDEQSSAATCDEIMNALQVANELIWSGDLIAARRAFIDNYNRQVDEAKLEGRAPKWWASLGFDEHSRHKAETKVIELNNLALPMDKRKELPAPQNQSYVSLDHIASKAAKKSSDPEKALKCLAEMKKKLK